MDTNLENWVFSSAENGLGVVSMLGRADRPPPRDSSIRDDAWCTISRNLPAFDKAEYER